MVRRLTVALALSSLALAACTAGDEPKDTGEDTLDLDHDGYAAPADCDDADPARHPGVDEVCDGVDNDCDGVVDEDPVDGVTGYPDMDGDGYGDQRAPQTACSLSSGWIEDGSDCDDDDGAVHPGADEHCDGADEDCDGETDEDAVDPTTWYADLDGDGYGDGTAPIAACSQPPDTAAKGGDCDDANAAEHPGAEELCNGVDDDCDGREGVGYTVPYDFATIADALAAVPEGGAICVQAGTYTEWVDFGGRSVTIEGVSADGVILDGGGGGTVVRVDGGEVAALARVTVTGGEALYGGGVYVGAGSTLRLDAVRIRDNVAEGCDAMGGGLYVEGAVEATDLELVGNAVVAAGASYCGADGGGLGVYLGEVVIRGLTSADNAAWGASAGGGAIGAYGGVVEVGGATFDGDRVVSDAYATVEVAGGGIGAMDTALNVTDATFTDVAVVVTDGSSCLAAGGALEARGGSAALAQVRVEGGGVDAACASFVYVTGGALDLAESEPLTVEDVALADTYARATSTGSYAYVTGGAAYVEPGGTGVIDGLRVTGAVAAADGDWYGALYGGGVAFYGPVEASHLWVSDVAASATEFGFGGGVYVADEATLTHVIVAGNALDAVGDAFGAGLSLEPYRARARVENADVVGNVATGEAAGGGGVQVQFATGVELVNVSVVGNGVVGATSAAGAAALVTDASPVSLAYVNAYANTGADAFTGLDGSGALAVDPLYVDLTAALAADWDLHLDSASPLVDAGDPGILDADGTRSDVGGYGGPEGSGW